MEPPEGSQDLLVERPGDQGAPDMADITVVGSGLAGLVASIASAENGARVRLHEAHQTLGGRARASAPPFIAHEGPHVLYDDGPLWRWLDERDLVGPAAHVPPPAPPRVPLPRRGPPPPLPASGHAAHARAAAPPRPGGPGLPYLGRRAVR